MQKLSDIELSGKIDITANNVQALSAPTGTATIIYLSTPTNVNATITGGQSVGYENDGKYFYYYIYPYVADGNGIKYAGNSGYVEIGDDGLGGDIYKIDLTWDAVTGVDGYIVYEEGYDRYWVTSTNSFSDNGTGGTSGSPLLTYSELYNEGYYTGYRVYTYNLIEQIYSATYLELNATDNGNADTPYVIKLALAEIEGCTFKALVEGDFAGTGWTVSKTSTTHIIIDTGSYSSDVTVTPTEVIEKAIRANSGVYLQGDSIVQDVNAQDITATSITAPVYKGVVTHDNLIFGTGLSMSGSSTLPLITSNGLGNTDTAVHSITKSVSSVVSQNLINVTLYISTTTAWTTATVNGFRSYVADINSANSNKINTYYSELVKSGTGTMAEGALYTGMITHSKGTMTQATGFKLTVSATEDGQLSRAYGTEQTTNIKTNGSIKVIAGNYFRLFLGTTQSGKRTTVTLASANYNNVLLNGATTIGRLCGTINSLTFHASSIVTDVIGNYNSLGTAPSGASITNAYGNYTEDVTAATNNYANFSNKGLNYFGDQVSVVGWQNVIQNVVKAYSSQAVNLVEWQNSSGTIMSGVSKNGGFIPVSMADSSAVNNTIYYSTTANRLVYKDSGGSVNALY